MVAELSLYDCNIASVDEIRERLLRDYHPQHDDYDDNQDETEDEEDREQYPIRSLNLHCNQLRSLQGFDKLPRLDALVELNLSSNAITKIEGLSSLRSLRILNLASNQITSVSGLAGLVNLTKLILAHNRIKSFNGFEKDYNNKGAVINEAIMRAQEVQSNRLETTEERMIKFHQQTRALRMTKNAKTFFKSLTYLDCADNMISSLGEVKHLRYFQNLKQLFLQYKDRKQRYENPICRLETYSDAILRHVPNLQQLDGCPVEQSGSDQRGSRPQNQLPVGDSISEFPALEPYLTAIGRSASSLSYSSASTISDLPAQEEMEEEEVDERIFSSISSLSELSPRASSRQPTENTSDDVRQQTHATVVPVTVTKRQATATPPRKDIASRSEDKPTERIIRTPTIDKVLEARRQRGKKEENSGTTSDNAQVKNSPKNARRARPTIEEIEENEEDYNSNDNNSNNNDVSRRSPRASPDTLVKTIKFLEHEVRLEKLEGKLALSEFKLKALQQQQQQQQATSPHRLSGGGTTYTSPQRRDNEQQTDVRQHAVERDSLDDKKPSGPTQAQVPSVVVQAEKPPKISFTSTAVQTAASAISTRTTSTSTEDDRAVLAPSGPVVPVNDDTSGTKGKKLKVYVEEDQLKLVQLREKQIQRELTRLKQESEREKQAAAENERKLNDRIESLCKELGAAKQTIVEQENHIASLAEQKKRLDEVIKENETLERTINDLKEEKRRLQQENEDKENLRATITKLERDIQSHKLAEEQLLKEVEAQKALVKQQERIHKREREEQSALHANEMNSILDRHSKEVENIRRLADASLKERDVQIEQFKTQLQAQYQDKLQENQKKINELQSAFEEATRNSTELKKMLKMSIQKEVRATAVATELSEIVKEQKKTIAELNKQKTNEVKTLKDTIAVFEAELQETRKQLKNTARLESQIRLLQDEIAWRDEEIEQHRNAVSRQKQISEQEFEQQQRALEQRLKLEHEAAMAQANAENARLLARVQQLEAESEKLQDDLKIRQKILEDQTDTIQKLKREMVDIKADCKDALEALDEELTQATKRCHHLEEKVEQKRQIIREMEEARAKREKKFEAAKRELDEKAEALIALEEQVRTLLADKAREWEDEKRQHEHEHEQRIKSQKESHEAELARLRRERDEQVAALNEEIARCKRTIAENEAEMRVLIRTIEKQKHDMDEDMKRLNSVFQDVITKKKS